MKSFEKKTVVITGGANGVGRALHRLPAWEPLEAGDVSLLEFLSVANINQVNSLLLLLFYHRLQRLNIEQADAVFIRQTRSVDFGG